MVSALAGCKFRRCSPRSVRFRLRTLVPRRMLLSNVRLGDCVRWRGCPLWMVRLQVTAPWNLLLLWLLLWLLIPLLLRVVLVLLVLLMLLVWLQRLRLLPLPLREWCWLVVIRWRLRLQGRLWGTWPCGLVLVWRTALLLLLRRRWWRLRRPRRLSLFIVLIFRVLVGGSVVSVLPHVLVKRMGGARALHGARCSWCRRRGGS